ncbi:hypothetical protein M5689_018129 [Euphorbia peplus]|nr:hypothetical protein M5689_018129 [Euphorbia peplus]
MDSYSGSHLRFNRSLFGEILQQLHHVKELRIKNLFMEILSDTEAECLISPMLNIKCLTLIYPDLSKHHFGIARLLRNSPALEELVIDMTLYYQYVADLPKLDYKSSLRTALLGWINDNENQTV